MRKWFQRGLMFLLSLVLIFSVTQPASATINNTYKAFVMAPLTHITDWTAFGKQLKTLKDNGVAGITTDVWWGDVEAAGDQVFDWSYYITYANQVRAAGLKWIPILSTHQCGGNVGDDCNVPLPSWIWGKGTADQLKFKSETGYMNGETLSPWWSGTATQYDELYASFAANFSSYKDIIYEINLSGGPAGELRYPSYQVADGWSYPSRGKLQAYTETAKTDFRNAMQTKYGTIAAVNSAWGTNLSAFTAINPPSDGDQFFITGRNTNYGKDFLNWYQSVLTKHLSAIATKAHNRFDSAFMYDRGDGVKPVPIAAKIAGIHWQMNNPSMPHAAEYGVGYYNYSTILDQFKTSNVNLTFTCLEMDDSKANSSPEYSAPQSLVINIATMANNKGITLTGENALPIVNDGQKYQNLAQALFNYNFSSFTLLRMANIVNSDGTGTAELSNFSDAIAMKPVPVTFRVKGANTASGEEVYITGSRWELGKWTTSVYAPKLTYSGGDWVGTVYLGSNRYYEFKALKKNSSGSVTWQSGANKTWTVPSTGGEYVVNW
ncbi:family 14 glycosylhydrolase [Paenibacillus sp. N1-5-1-14]|uniref:family 14 glycosylhydrolase n=1 Tax=Paenibacillus radicibacter TaxID=2972488 RepID=UPI0021590E91|nr:family 14 glycosylhydrolase [Paenibacillus radicibacter]MCR8645123.1 family 14 glycosylhydrolase [Paenibacillus radicibacter]